MRKLFTTLYTAWAAFWLVFLFLLLFPFFWLFLQREEWKPKAHYLNRLWGKLYFPIIFIPVQIEYEEEPATDKAYVFCANHFSYMDIAAMGLILKNYYAFVGKSVIKKVPLFGYMFARLHIQVDRDDKSSRVKSLSRSIRALQSGRSIVIFPEGGIKSKKFPKMHKPFKDGAFAMAVQQQVPIVPITFLNNYKIMEDSKMRVHPMTLRAIVHKPIDTTGMSQEDIDSLKEQTFAVIQGALDKFHSK
ncbi:1-acyl-sn-glycerol-3-phosphate acyltransferase [Pseudarcicella hirudinis]|uniref:1-acyl-sn-glycerol-3-phosphate acyltransferase n=1 Tax=Pseudarcicella hirudinis TaxID=1079859 RepID=A0A1I5X1V3_9BACT|nr:lysophospholipid acyltransferase family protein [Pseudarcicella hirudinis]SFQ25890.1 1-acyl-sn-glycerol-3-phosphate acyltransferase [Pseudarcicella hirudinis]